MGFSNVWGSFRELIKQPSMVAGKRVLEIWSGTGLQHVPPASCKGTKSPKTSKKRGWGTRCTQPRIKVVSCLFSHVWGLFRELIAQPSMVAGKRVLEIGSGTGLCGVFAAKLGAAEVGAFPC